MGLSVSAVSAKQAQYYIDAVAKGREDYYSGDGEAAPTAFRGRTDGGWERPEQVSVDTVAEMLKLGEEGDHRKNVAYDLTFSVPKSVSVLWATGDAETRAVIEKNLRLASEAAVGSMHWYAREGHAGARVIEVDPPANMFDFRHRTSRALDPQLHSHILVENRIEVDGRALTLDGREVYAQAKNAGMVFDSVLRRGLTEELGVAWEPTKANGASGDIRGVSKELIAFWSSRRADIEAKLDGWKAEFEAATGREPTAREQRKAAEGFTLSTRRKKTGSHSSEDLLSRWQSEGKVYQTNALADAPSAAASWASTQRGTREDIQNRLVGARPSRGDSADALVAAVDAHSQPTLNRWQLEVEARKTLPQRERETPAEWSARVEALCEQAARSGALVAIPIEGDSPRSERYTTQGQIAKEREVVDVLASKGHDGRAGRKLAEMSAEYAQAAVAAGTLSQEQAEAIQMLAGAETRGAALIGAPGVGKTTTLGVMAEAASEAGWTVTGLASTGRAAAELSGATERGGGQSSTIANWLIERRREAGVPTTDELMLHWAGSHPGPEVPRHELIMLDESSITSTDDLAKIAAYARYAEARVILVGDHRQIGSVDKGGMLLGIATAEGAEAERVGLARIPTATIETVVRQREEWERRAAEQLRQGGAKAEMAVDAYAEHGRVHAVAGTLEAKREIAARMADDVAAGKHSIAIGYTGNAVNQLNAAVVAELVNRGELPQETLPDFGFRTGQQVITRKNLYEATETRKREMVVKNGDRWTVVGQVGSGQEAELVVEKLGSGERRTLDRGYVEATISGGGRQVQAGYASTPITIQSASLDGSSYTLASEQAASSSILVPMTRGKDENHLFVPTGVEARTHDPLVATAERQEPQAEAVSWFKAKAAAAPAEKDKSALHHLAQARERAAAIKEAAERGGEAAREAARAATAERQAQEEQNAGRMI